MQTGEGEGGREPGRGGGRAVSIENRRGTISICENTERSKKEGGGKECTQQRTKCRWEGGGEGGRAA